MGTPKTYVPVPFESGFAELAMRLSTRLSDEGGPFQTRLVALLDAPAGDGLRQGHGADLVETARRILRASEPGRRAVILAMANKPGAEVKRDLLLEAFAKASGLKKADPKQLYGLLGSFVRRAKKERLHPPIYDSYPSGDGFTYRMDSDLAKAFLQASKTL